MISKENKDMGRNSPHILIVLPKSLSTLFIMPTRFDSIGDPIDVDKDGNALTLMDVMSEENNVLEDIDLRLKSELLHHLLEQNLGKREREILIMRYGLKGSLPLTQREVAAKLDISRSYVSRIEKRAIATLKKQFAKLGQTEF